MRWSPQLSSIVFLLISQLRPLSPKAATLHCICWPSGEAVSRTAARLTSTRVEAAWQRMSSTSSQGGNARLPEHTAAQQKRRTQAFSVPKRRLECAWMGPPKLPQVLIFTIITNAMRRPLVVRGVGDFVPAKAESPTLFCSWAIRLAILALRKLNRQPYFVSLLFYTTTFSWKAVSLKTIMCSSNCRISY